MISVFTITGFAYAINPIDTVLCEEKVLRCGGKHILVSRLTGEVKYAIGKSGQWVPATGPWKRQLQMAYDVQRQPEIEWAKY